MSIRSPEHRTDVLLWLIKAGRRFGLAGHPLLCFVLEHADPHFRDETALGRHFEPFVRPGTTQLREAPVSGSGLAPLDVQRMIEQYRFMGALLDGPATAVVVALPHVSLYTPPRVMVRTMVTGIWPIMTERESLPACVDALQMLHCDGRRNLSKKKNKQKVAMLKRNKDEVLGAISVALYESTIDPDEGATRRIARLYRFAAALHLQADALRGALDAIERIEGLGADVCRADGRAFAVDVLDAAPAATCAHAAFTRVEAL